MLGVALQWRRARWFRHSPGATGLLLLSIVPLSFLAPLHDVPLFQNWMDGATAIFWLGTVLLTAVLARESGLVVRNDVWPFQKSIAIVDWHLCNWLLDGAAALMMLLWWASLLAAGLAVHAGWNNHVFAGTLLSGILLLLLVHSFLFFIGATGAPRGIDIFIVAALLGVFRDLLLSRAPDFVRLPLRALFPPILDAYVAGKLLLEAQASAFKPLLSVLAYSFVCCTGAILLLRRAKPPV